jgi:hypothetical protein
MKALAATNLVLRVAMETGIVDGWWVEVGSTSR